jgi:hypothetical protein
LGFETSRIPGYIEITKPKNKKENNVELKKIKDYLMKINDNNIQPSYMNKKSLDSLTNINILQRVLNKQKLKDYYYSLESSLRGHTNFFGEYAIEKLLNHFYILIKRNLRVIINFFESNSIKENIYNENVKNIVFPLHFHPEASTSMASPDYINEYDLIRYLTTQISGNYIFYIKEHPSMFGIRSRKEIKSLQRLPNVVYLPSSASTNELINKCDLIITLTSTMGLEGLLKGKPVIALGDVFYNSHRNCKYVKTNIEVLNCLLDFLNEKWIVNNDNSEHYNIEFIKNHLFNALDYEVNFNQPEFFPNKGKELADKFNDLLNA